ncbi:NAD(P)-binding domain-containing protein [Nocardia asteroides]|uniref:NADPH-dependent F420 reductase n=1 Tax=Nocardia asteroides TaxID=1824 RepID=UPI00343FFD17
MCIAIVGLGRIGTGLALLLARSDQDVIVADRSPSKARTVATSYPRITAAPTITRGVSEADVVIPAIPFAALAGFIDEHAAQLAGKTLIDPTNPVSFDRHGPTARLVGDNESGGTVIAAHLPTGVAYAKAFGTLGADTLVTAAGTEPRTASFYVADSTATAAVVEELIRAAGYDPIPAGDIESSADIELQGALHQYGGIGGTITGPAARAAAARARHAYPERDTGIDVRGQRK